MQNRMVYRICFYLPGPLFCGKIGKTIFNLAQGGRDEGKDFSGG